jgi:hypothetical protein
MTKPFDQYSASEQEFIDQRTRQVCVVWADTQINTGAMPKYEEGSNHLIYVEYAKTKKWVSADGTKLLSAGYLTAIRFLKR